jgi:hypothetical protein
MARTRRRKRRCDRSELLRKGHCSARNGIGHMWEGWNASDILTHTALMDYLVHSNPFKFKSTANRARGVQNSNIGGAQEEIDSTSPNNPDMLSTAAKSCPMPIPFHLLPSSRCALHPLSHCEVQHLQLLPTNRAVTP